MYYAIVTVLFYKHGFQVWLLQSVFNRCLNCFSKFKKASAQPFQHPLPWLHHVTSEQNDSALPLRALHELPKRFSPNGKSFATETFSSSEMHSFSSDVKCAGKPKTGLDFEWVPWDVLRSLCSYRRTARRTPDMHPRMPRGFECHKAAWWYTRHNPSGQLQIACTTALWSEGKRVCCTASLWAPTKGHAGQCFTSDRVFRETPLAGMPNGHETL